MQLRALPAVLLLTFLPLIAAYGQSTTLVASLDRELIRANESFTYTLLAEGRVSGRPDFSVLQRDFDLMQSRSSRNIQILNGRTTEVAEWTVELMPRAAGTFELPPVQLGNLSSNPVRVDILPPLSIDEADGDVFLEVELDRPAVYVQAEAIFTLRLFVGIDLGRATLSAVPIEGGEAIVERLGSDRDFQTLRGDRLYRVLERKFAIFPQTTGTLSIGPVEYTATVMQGLAGFARRQNLRSEVLDLTVLPAVAPPPSHPNAVWLPARNLRIEESWRDGGDFEQGVPRTRQLTVIAAGVLETQIPDLSLTESPGLRQYADQPERSREVTSTGIEARNTKRFAVVAQQPGTVEFPAVELPWWNVDEQRWEVARIEAGTVEVDPAANPGTQSATLPAPETEVVIERDAGVWPWVAGALGFGWLVTLAAWAFSSRTERAKRSPRSASLRSAPKVTSGRALTKQLTAACRVDDAERARELLLKWAARQFSEDPPGSLGELAGRLTGPLADEIGALENALYGRERGIWQGERLAELLRTTQSVAPGPAKKDQDPLVPLYR
jgi:hypothetical protein